MKSIELNATLTERIDVNPELAIFKVRPDGAPIPDFVPGQYATLGLPDPKADPAKPKLIARAYSIASAPNERAGLEFVIVVVREGQLTPLLWELPVGGRIWLAPKCKGTFTMEELPPERDLLMVSTGTGIAPFISMLRAYRGQNRWRRLILVNGVRLPADLAYREELAAAARSPDVRYLPFVTRDPSWDGLQGRVSRVLEDALYQELVGAPLTPEDCHVFLCGNPDMIAQMETALEARGFRPHSKRSPGNIHVEKYW
jgi:ferredoxin--NADP+ reductase